MGLRHLLNLVVQVGVGLYVFWEYLTDMDSTYVIMVDRLAYHGGYQHFFLLFEVGTKYWGALCWPHLATVGTSPPRGIDIPDSCEAFA